MNKSRVANIVAKKASGRVWLRFGIWCALFLLLASYLIRSLLISSPINSNIMDLIPASHLHPRVEKSITLFSNRMAKQVIFLIGNANQKAAQKAAKVFYHQLAGRGVFSQVHYQVTGNEQNAWASFYFPYRLSLLSAEDADLFDQQKTNKILESALLSVFSPMSIVNTETLKNDPFFLFQHFVTSLPKPASKVSLVDHTLMVHSRGAWYVMITAKMKGQSFSIADQNLAMSLIWKSEQAAMAAVPNSHVLKTGMLFYASAGAQSAQHDISTIGVGSLIGIILLMLLTFRSLSPLVLTLLSTAVGLIAAFAVTVFVFTKIYLFTLIFGASLIGIAVDYAFFYYADQLLGGEQWTAEHGLRNILPGISFGLLNVALAYLILFFTPFPALKQLTVFAISGLSMAFLTVVCVFPLLLRAKPKTYVPLMLKLARYYLQRWMRLSKKHMLLLLAVIIAVAIGGLVQLHSNDDIRILETIPIQLKKQEQQVKQLIGSNMGMNFYVVMAKSPALVLQRESALTLALKKDFPKVSPAYMAITSYLPTQASQQHIHQLQIGLVQSSLLDYLKKIGMDPVSSQAIQRKLLSPKFKPLTIASWLQSPVSQALRFLWLGKVTDQYASVVLLSSQLDAQQLQLIAHKLPGVSYVNKASEISQTFKRYRHNMSYLLGVVYLVLLSWLMLRYGWRKALAYCVPPVCASLLSLAALGYLAIPLTLFNVLGLILVLGIGVDYVLFFAEARSSYVTTMLAVSLSAVTTVLSFGLLAFSATPVIHYFGVLVLVGISSSFLLSPWSVCMAKRREL